MASRMLSAYARSVEAYGNPVLDYWRAIQDARIRVPRKVREMVRRLARDIETPREPWVYDTDRANHALFFIEGFCKHTKGKWGGKPVVLELWQRSLIAAAFGFIDVNTGLRRFRKVMLVVGRKNGKSTLAAAVGLYLLIADGEPGAEIYCAATKKDQAKIIWLEARRMVRKSPALSRRLKCLVAEIVGRERYDGCVMKPLGADSETQDGLNVHGALMDEIHAWQGIDLSNVIVDGMSAREQPMEFITTTAGTVRNGLYDEEYAAASNMLDGIEGFEDDTVLAMIYELDSVDDLTDEANWQKANPGLGTIKNLETLRRKVQKARANPRYMPNLLCKEFDMIATADDAWLSFDEIENPETCELEALRGCYAIGGADLSATTDLTCASLIVRRRGDDKVYVRQHYFIPEKRVEQLEADGKTREAPYRTWEQRGLITICPGNVVDYHQVTEWFLKLYREYEIRPLWVCYDRAFAGYWVQEMADWFDMERIPQGAFTWSQPMKEMGAALAAHRVNYDNNPITKWCLTNTRAKSRNADGIESIEPKKINEKMRIDGTVSLLNAWVGYVKHYEDYMAYVEQAS